MINKKVTIVGAGNVGATAGLMLAMRGIKEVCLIDLAAGMPQGKALDLMHMRPIADFPGVITGTNDYKDTAGSDIVVITAGMPRKPGMTRDDLLAINSSILESVVSFALEASPNAILIVVTNPLDVMTYLAFKKSGLPSNRVIGMGGVLDSARLAFAVAEKTGADPSRIDACAMGAHGDAMTPMPRFTTVDGVPITEILSEEDVEAVMHRTIFAGAEVVSHLKTGSAFYAPGMSIAKMVLAIAGDTHETMPCCALLSGEYGIDDVAISVPVVLGAKGIERIVELDFNEEELTALQHSAATVSATLDALKLRL